MLKWTVVKRDAFAPMDTARRSSLGGGGGGGELGGGSKAKRRRSRRSSTGGATTRRSSLGLNELDKENRFTSTPIKDDAGAASNVAAAFRDVSNLTPKATTSGGGGGGGSRRTKKKKPCADEHFLAGLDADATNANYFRPFEAVDSHIEGSFLPDCPCPCLLPPTPVVPLHPVDQPKTPAVYAPTLPTFALDYSPNNVASVADVLCQPKVEHVNDILQRISLLTASPDELRRRLPGYRPKTSAPGDGSSSVVATPNLVKRFIDERLRKRKKMRTAPPLPAGDDSSFINDLSLDKIVDALLDTSSSAAAQNECNRSTEQNRINAAKLTGSATSIATTTSTDSGFRSSTTTIHDEKFGVVEATMINLEGTFNERCVDDRERISLKRPSREDDNDDTDYTSSSSLSSSSSLLESSQVIVHGTRPKLKRQKCIRQKKQPNNNNNNNHKDDDNSFESGRSEQATVVVTSPEMLHSVEHLKDEEVLDRGTIDLDVQYNRNTNQLAVNIYRCAGLRRNNGQSVNAYIKVALSDGRRKHRGTLQRTPVQPESAAPVFAHAFRVSLPSHHHHRHHRHRLRHQDSAAEEQDTSNALIAADKVLYVEVWHRDRTTRRSEFLGCTSFAIKDVLNQIISGSFKLSTQWSTPCDTASQDNNRTGTPPSSPSSPPPVLSAKHGTSNGGRVVEVVAAAGGGSAAVTMSASDAHHTSIDELLLDDGGRATTHQPPPQHQQQQQSGDEQKSADENLFLRYLELDPLEGPDAAPAAAQRKASGNKHAGRTPFTQTKTLRRGAPKSGFGFSVVWTHPPRIERVERGLPAERAGIQPGDYLIFVDKHNVVMMPEVEILNHIRSLGNLLTLEIFRRDPTRNGSGSMSAVVPAPPTSRPTSCVGFERAATTDSGSTTAFIAASSMSSVAAAAAAAVVPPAPASTATPRRPSTVCSTNTASVEYSRKKLHLPQVTFSSERPTTSGDEARRKAMYQIIACEQQYATNMQFAVARYVQALHERKDLIAPQEHRILFQNTEELLRISEEIIDHLVQVDGDYHTGGLLKVYAAKLAETTSAYKRYCGGIKKADCVLANLLKSADFARFIATPAIPRRRPDLTAFIHKPLEHYRDVLKLFSVILANTKTHQTEEYNVVNHIVHELQTHYREMTSQAGLMEPVGEGRPLLSVQDLETRLVFTKCKPFVLSKPGRQWIFGGDLSRVEGRTVRQYWALLFSDILLFAKVSRDRVLFILEEPLPLAHISEMYFSVRKKENEFRIIVEPGGGNGAATNRNTAASSPTVHCGPDLSRTPRKNPNKRCLILRTPTVELKAVWQNLLQRQIFHINAGGADGSQFSSPLESPDCHPITSSVVTLQSAESLSRHHQPTSTGRHHSILQQHHHQPLQHQQQQQPAPRYNYPNNMNINMANNNLNNNHSAMHSDDAARKQLDELIEHKCKQLEKSATSSKSNAIHLEQWMKGQFNGDATNNNGAGSASGDGDAYTDGELEDELELWTEEQVRKRSEELKLIDPSGDPRIESRLEEQIQLDDDQSPSRSTNTTESQVTVRSSPLVPEAVSMCKRCHKTCYNPSSQQHHQQQRLANGCYRQRRQEITVGDDEDDDWRPLMLMGLTAANPCASLVHLDPFAMPVPQIAVVPATPDTPQQPRDCCNCTPTKSFALALNKSYENTAEVVGVEDEDDDDVDDSPVLDADEQPYHSLHSSNLTLRRFGTVSSLERVGSEEEALQDEEEETNDIRTTELVGMDNEGFNNTLMAWTARAGSFVAAKMAFLEKLPDYLKTEIAVNGNGDDLQEEETSGGTSGEEVWGTPTSGGELDDPLSSPPYDGHQSPHSGASLSSNEDTELMMDELLMTPPVTSSNIRGLLPRRTLEPLMEEEFSDTYTSTSSSSPSPTPTEQSASPEQGNGTGDAADECGSAAVKRSPSPASIAAATTISSIKCNNIAATGGAGSAAPVPALAPAPTVGRSSSASSTRLGVASLRSTSTTPPANRSAARTAMLTTVTAPAPAASQCNSTSHAGSSTTTSKRCPPPVPPRRNPPKTAPAAEVGGATADSDDSDQRPIFIRRSDSYQKIIEAADDSVGFFTRFRNRPSMKYLNIERIPPSRGVKFLEFFNVRRERKIYETFPGGKHLIKVFNREEDDEGGALSYAEKPDILHRIKQERQLDRRFWKQLSKRRNSNSPNRQTASTTSSASPVMAVKSTVESSGAPVSQPTSSSGAANEQTVSA